MRGEGFKDLRNDPFHNPAYTTDLNQDLNGDGVELLMAYALNLSPHANLAGSLPGVTYGPGTMSLSFYGASPGITYTVKRSFDLQEWVTDGVSLTPPDANGMRTATVDATGSSAFVRLQVDN